MKILKKILDGGMNASVNEGEKKKIFWNTVSSYFQNKTILLW